MATGANSFAEIEAHVEAAIRKNPRFFLLSEAVIGRMEQHGLTTVEIDRIVGEPDLRRHDEIEGMLSAAASERAARLARIVSLSQKTFGSQQKAFHWLRTQSAPLANLAPIDCIQRESGARMVEDILIRIGHGIAA